MLPLPRRNNPSRSLPYLLAALPLAALACTSSESLTPLPACPHTPAALATAAATNALPPYCAIFAAAPSPSAPASAQPLSPPPDGTPERPYPTLRQALDHANNRPIIACNRAPFIETLTLTETTAILGAFDCTTPSRWTHQPDRKTLLAGKTPGEPALTLTRAPAPAQPTTPQPPPALTLQGITLLAPSAITLAGASSTALALAADTTADLRACDLIANDAGPGQDGRSPEAPPTPGANAPTALTNACAELPTGGKAATTTCPDGTTTGGDGGDGGDLTTATGNGHPGADGDAAIITYGKAGSGALAQDQLCQDGLPGAPGEDTDPGLGGRLFGEITLHGVTGESGNPGKPGHHGHGGGGGGGARIGLCSTQSTLTEGNGAPGGGGGAGGCGGAGGTGGKAGGSSIGILNLGANLTLTAVTITTGQGGKGGNGGHGQKGAPGGQGASGGKPPSSPGTGQTGCRGGDGGHGGAGGPGGGAHGGHSIGVLYKAKAPPLQGYTTFLGPAGEGGVPLGPIEVDDVGTGNNGVTAPCWDASAEARCPIR